MTVSPYVCAYEFPGATVVHALHKTVGVVAECGCPTEHLDTPPLDFPPNAGACALCMSAIRRDLRWMEERSQ